MSAASKVTEIKANTLAKEANDNDHAAALASGDMVITYTGSTNTDVANEADWFVYVTMGAEKEESFANGVSTSTFHQLNWGSQLVYTTQAQFNQSDLWFTTDLGAADTFITTKCNVNFSQSASALNYKSDARPTFGAWGTQINVGNS